MQGLQELGWGVGRNVRVDVRGLAADPDLNQHSPGQGPINGCATPARLIQSSRTTIALYIIFSIFRLSA
jgi:hypothetical protein